MSGMTPPALAALARACGFTAATWRNLTVLGAPSGTNITFQSRQEAIDLLVGHALRERIAIPEEAKALFLAPQDSAPSA